MSGDRRGVPRRRADGEAAEEVRNPSRRHRAQFEEMSGDAVADRRLAYRAADLGLDSTPTRIRLEL